MNRVLLRTVELVLLSLALGVAVVAQTVTTTTTTAQAPEAAGQDKLRRPGKRVPQQPALVTVIPSEPPVQPQVVTIIHRLSGVKVLRMLLRTAGSGVVETIDPQTITSDAHASIIAGWALEDGKTIAARLPQASAEFEITEFTGWLPDQKVRIGSNSPFPFVRTRVQPDLTVVTSDGRKLRARLVGLDAETGLSVLQIVGGSTPAAAPPIAATLNLALGQTVEIFAPEPAKPEGQPSTRATFVKVGKFEATVANPLKTSSGFTEKLALRSEKLSLDVIGGVVCDAAGATVGIVDSIDGKDVQIVAADTIRAATKRVLERQASVPRPLLGVRGEPVEFAVRTAFLSNGWHEDQLNDLIAAKMGILLTAVVPRTPAALAKLKAGDIILSVNEFEVKTAEQFSKLLGNAGSGEQVRFTVRRPDTPTPISIPVTLGGSFSPLFEGRFELPRMPQLFGLQQLGLRTMELASQAATNLGAQHGLIVVGVQPDSPAARGGLREGDVIETIDGRIAARGLWALLSSTPRKKHTFWLVREGEKKKVVVEVE